MQLHESSVRYWLTLAGDSGEGQMDEKAPGKAPLIANIKVLGWNLVQLVLRLDELLTLSWSSRNRLQG